MKPSTVPRLLRIARGVAGAALCAAAGALFAAVPAATAEDFPRLAPGLWEMDRGGDAAPAKPKADAKAPAHAGADTKANTGANAGADANRMTLCLDRSLTKEMFEMGVGMMRGMCSRHEFHLSGRRGTGNYVCDMGGSRMHSTSTLVLDGDTAYRMEIHTTWDPPFMGRASSDTVLTAHRAGPCLPGQRPGDLTTAQGRKFNIRDALQRQHGAGH